jgi:cobalt transporter subunit CbtB
MTANQIAASVSAQKNLAVGVVLFLVGGALVFMVGLSHLAAAHNAAHDTRHAIGFPCH